MARHKDFNWTLPDGTPTLTAKLIMGRIYTSLLMDIRDELKAINRVLSCSNFLQIPAKLDRIQLNTRKQKRIKGGVNGKKENATGRNAQGRRGVEH